MKKLLLISTVTDHEVDPENMDLDDLAHHLRVEVDIASIKIYFVVYYMNVHIFYLLIITLKLLSVNIVYITEYFEVCLQSFSYILEILKLLYLYDKYINIRG